MIAFSTDDLNSVFRLEVDDLLEGDGTVIDSENLWKNVEIFQYMTEAGDRVAKDTEGLFKVLSPITQVIGTQQYRLPPYVFKIRSLRLVTANRYLEQVNADDDGFPRPNDYGQCHSHMSRFFSNHGPSGAFMLDYYTNQIFLGAKPTIVDTMEIQATVTLATPLVAGMPLPFMDTGDQRLMLHYMKYLAYSKQDADTLDLARSEGFKKHYDMEMEDRKLELRRRRRKPGTVRSSY